MTENRSCDAAELAHAYAVYDSQVEHTGTNGFPLIGTIEKGEFLAAAVKSHLNTRECAGCEDTENAPHATDCAAKPLTFALSITLGNDVMLSNQDIADALVYLAVKLRRDSESGLTDGVIRDVNGNTVGSWAVQ